MAKEIISESRLREIISEEAARFKKKLTLEAEKKKLLSRLQEMYMEEEKLDEEDMQEGWLEEAEGDVSVPKVTPAMAQSFMKATGVSAEELAQAAAEEADELQNIGREAKEAAEVAPKVLQALEEAKKMMESYLEEADEVTAKQNVAEVKVRLGKILRNIGIGGAMASIILGGVAWALGTTPGLSNYSIANPMLYASLVSMLLSIVSVAVGMSKSKKGVLQLAADFAKDENLLKYVDAYKKSTDRVQQGKITLAINKMAADYANTKGVAADQVLTFQDAVKDMVGVSRKQ